MRIILDVGFDTGRDLQERMLLGFVVSGDYPLQGRKV